MELSMLICLIFSLICLGISIPMNVKEVYRPNECSVTHSIVSAIVMATGITGIIVLLIVIFVPSEPDVESVKAEPIEQIVTPIHSVVVIETTKEVPVEVVVYKEYENETELTEDEIELLAAVVHAEAGNQDQVGKRLVVDVILNRMYSDKFPDTVTDVIYQKYNGQWQFSSVPNLGKQIITEDDFNAVYAEMRERLDTNIVYFKLNGYHTFAKGEYQHGAHYFSSQKGE